MATIIPVEFFNLCNFIRVDHFDTQQQQNQIEYIHKRNMVLRKTGPNTFHFRQNEHTRRFHYDECSTINPSGHSNIDQLLSIFLAWLNKTCDFGGPLIDGLGPNDQVFCAKFRYDKLSLLFDEIIQGNATITHHPAKSHVALRTSLDPTSRAVYQTKQYFSFVPGKRFSIVITGVIRTEKVVAGNVVRLGYFDDIKDKVTGEIGGGGVYFKIDETGIMYIGRRYYENSVQVEEEVHQDNWSADIFDGFGASASNLDPTQVQLYLIQVDQNGGHIRMGFIIRGDIHWAHEFNNANFKSLASIFSTTLPLRVETENTGTPSNIAETTLFNMLVVSELNYVPCKKTICKDTDTSTILCVPNQIKPILSIRLRQVRNRATISPVRVKLWNNMASGIARWMLILNPDSITNPNWTDVHQHSVAQYSTDATAMTVGNGLIIACGYTDSKYITEDIQHYFNDFHLHSNIRGNKQDIITLAAQFYKGVSDITAALEWDEF